MSRSAKRKNADRLKWQIARNVVRRREELGIGRAECARRAGVSVSAIGAIERGERQPFVSTLMAIAAALERTPEDILRGPRGSKR